MALNQLNNEEILTLAHRLSHDIIMKNKWFSMAENQEEKLIDCIDYFVDERIGQKQQDHHEKEYPLITNPGIIHRIKIEILRIAKCVDDAVMGLIQFVRWIADEWEYDYLKEIDKFGKTHGIGFVLQDSGFSQIVWGFSEIYEDFEYFIYDRNPIHSHWNAITRIVEGYIVVFLYTMDYEIYYNPIIDLNDCIFGEEDYNL